MGVIFTKPVPGNASRRRLCDEVIAAVNGAAGSVLVCCAWPSADPMRFEGTRALTSPESAAADAAIAAHDPQDPVPPEPGAPGPHSHSPSEVTGTAVITTDPRLSDARTPTAHVHPTSAVTGLDAALAGKADTGHAHAGLPSFFVLASDVSTGANVTPVNVPGLLFPFVANGRYVVEVFGSIQNALATTGIGLQLDANVAVTLVTFEFSHQLANAGTLTGGSSIADDASVGVSSGVPTTARVPFRASGTLIAGATPGTAQLRFRSETTAAATLKANTIMRVQSV